MEQPIAEPVAGDVSLSDFTVPPTTFPGILVAEERLNRTVVIHTEKGDITVTLFGDEAPAAVSNFLILANTGFYNGVRFHRVIEDFMIQTGDPQSKEKSLITRWGTGGPGYQFPDELGRGHNTYEPGTLAMANSGSNTNGSQFFIMHGATPITNLYTIFGQVTAGLDIVNAIAAVETSGPPTDAPLVAPVIASIEVVPLEVPSVEAE
ncbi:TPA: peptidylprolyl isomerase [Candidatus Uhrbacteria bacterium]|nr:peptidylprolyl isomerase [Candidatus Uhrbacteria bacterium]